MSNLRNKKVRRPPNTPLTRRDSDTETKVIKSPSLENRLESDSITSCANEDVYPIEKDPFFVLDFFVSSLYATALEDAIAAIRILDECDTKMNIIKVLNDMPKLLNRKFGILEPEKSLDDLDAINPKQLGCEEYKRHKYMRDRDEVEQILLVTYKSLAIESSFRPLWNHCHAFQQRKENAEYLEQDETRNRNVRKSLIKHLRQQRIQQKSAKYEYNDVQEALRNVIEDAETTTEIKKRYVQNWQNSRIEQHKEIIEKTENNYFNSTESFKKKSEQEALVHEDIDTFVNICIKETLAKIEEWMDKYEKDSEAIDLRIQIKRNEYYDALEKRIKMEKALKKHAEEMKKWILFKEERARARQYVEDMYRSAIIVQAWWRGLLVRKKLGPFREQNKGKGKKKTGGKRKTR